MKAISDAIAPILDQAGRALAMAGRKSPWGSGSGNEGEEPANPASGGPASGGDEPKGPRPDPAPGPRNPWLPGGTGSTPPKRASSIEDILRQRVKRPGGGGGGGGGGLPPFPRRPDGRSWMPYVLGGLAAVWLLLSTTHMIGVKEQGIVTTFGKYSRTVGAGLSLTLPWPMEQVDIEDVTSIKRDTIPEGEAEKLMLTSDQNLVDISYIVRWNIKDLKLYKFQLDDPADSVKEVAEAAMRASIAEVPLREAMGGSGRALIEQNVRQRMQGVLDAYRAGVLIQGVDIKKADPPTKVIDAFQKVTAAQQGAQREMSNAQAWAQQVTARAQGDASQFDQVYAQYKLAPEVTRRRIYYETMERVLANNDKVIVEAGGGVTSYLPLPEVKRRAAAPAAAAPAGGN